MVWCHSSSSATAAVVRCWQHTAVTSVNIGTSLGRRLGLLRASISRQGFGTARAAEVHAPATLTSLARTFVMSSNASAVTEIHRLGLGRVCHLRRAYHHPRRCWRNEKRREGNAVGLRQQNTTERLSSSIHTTNVCSLRYDASREGDDAARNLTLKIADDMRVHDIVRPRDRVVVCVSGGLDSIALLHILADLREDWSLDLHVLHFNHGKRAESEEEEKFVRGLSTQLPGGVRVHVRHPAKPFEAANFQAKARAWRREEAQKLMDQVGAQVIVQGHHADDQTETVLLKLLRGCHLSRVSGMSRRDGKFGRPLLDVSKDELRDYLTSRSIPWREDASNDDSAFLRNRVRAELVPLLRELTHGPLEERLHSITTQSEHLRSWLDSHPSAVLPSSPLFGDSVMMVHASGGVEHDEKKKKDDDDAGDHEQTTTTTRRYPRDGELDMNAWRQLPGMVQEDQLYEYVFRSTGLQLRYRNLRKIWKHMMQTDNNNISWDWRLGKDWILVRAGDRVWTRRYVRENVKTGGKTTKKNFPACELPRVTSSSGVEVENEEGSVIRVGRGVIVSYPKDWTVRAFWEDEKVDDDVKNGIAADVPGMRLANVPEGSILRLRMRQPKDRFRPPERRDGKAVRLKDWMRHNDFPLHARDRTPVLCLDSSPTTIVAVYPGYLGSNLAPAVAVDSKFNPDQVVIQTKSSITTTQKNNGKEGAAESGMTQKFLRVIVDATRKNVAPWSDE